MHSESQEYCLNKADLLHVLTAYQWDLICGPNTQFAMNTFLRKQIYTLSVQH